MRDQTGSARVPCDVRPPVGRRRVPLAGRSPGRPGLTAGVSLLVAAAILASTAPSWSAPNAARYYFQLHEVQSRVPLDAEIRQFAGEALKAELASRPEWESDLGGVTEGDALAAELKRRRLSGFDVVVKISELKKEVKEANPGSKLKRLSVMVKLSVLGTTLPGEKIAFGGDGEAGTEAELTDRRIEAEGQAMIKDSIKDAVKQAVDQVVLKLGAPRSQPHNEAKRKRRKS